MEKEIILVIVAARAAANTLEILQSAHRQFPTEEEVRAAYNYLLEAHTRLVNYAHTNSMDIDRLL